MIANAVILQTVAPLQYGATDPVGMVLTVLLVLAINVVIYSFKKIRDRYLSRDE